MGDFTKMQSSQADSIYDESCISQFDHTIYDDSSEIDVKSEYKTFADQVKD